MEHRRPKILVVGDVMLDLWIDVAAKFLNPEGAATVAWGDGENRDATLGGAGLVASLLSSLGARVKMMSRVGADAPGATVHGLIHEFGLGCKNVAFVDDYVTPAKLRFVNEHGVVVFRYDEESDSETYMDHESRDFNFELFNKNVEKANCLVVADYGKGFCQDYGKKMIEAARYYGVLSVVGAKPGLLNDYNGADVIKVNATEAATFLEMHNLAANDYKERATLLCERLAAKAAIVTTGKHGAIVAVRRENGDYFTAHVPARLCTPMVMNCVGAGDAYLSGLAVQLMMPPRIRPGGFSDAVFDPERVVMAAAAGAATAAQYLNRGWPEVDPATPYLAAFDYVTNKSAARKLVSFTDAQVLCQAWRSTAEKVVFTNGCFDLLHRGHVSMLEQARQQGSRLIVALNTDDSVRLLKGDNRPVQDFQTRAQVLASLGCVDAVVALNEEDFVMQPELRAMITQFVPDVLVKGAQYEESEIVGWEEMVNRDPPGRIWRCPMVDACSTTQTVAKVQNNGK